MDKQNISDLATKAFIPHMFLLTLACAMHRREEQKRAGGGQTPAGVRIEEKFHPHNR